MRNIFIIGLIVVSMAYMFSLLYDKYDSVIKEENSKKALEQKWEKRLKLASYFHVILKSLLKLL